MKALGIFRGNRVTTSFKNKTNFVHTSSPQRYLYHRFGFISTNTLIKEHFLATFLLLVVLTFFYRDVVFNHRTFLQLGYTAGTMPFSTGGGAYGYPGRNDELRRPPEDTAANGWVNEPYARRAGAIIKQGEVPLWNPSQGMGEPFLADGNSAPLEPIQFLSSLVPETYWPLTTDIQVLLRFFLAGFFTYLFARAIGLQLIPSVFAGSAFMLTSYFVAFGNHPQMRPETLLPVVIYSYDRLIKKITFGSILLGACATAWVIIASFPESSFLVLVLAGSWYVYRAFLQFWDTRFEKKQIRRLTGRFILTVILGISLAAFFVFPLVENIQTSLHIHEQGVGLASYPVLFTALSIMAGLIANVGWVPHFYTTVIILACFGLIVASIVDDRRRMVWFFAVYGIVFYLKIYGISLVQWIGYLPGFSQVLIPKYIAPTVSFCFAILAAFGIEMIALRKIRYRAVLAVFSVFAFVIVYTFTFPDFDPQKLITRAYFVTVVAFAVCALACLGMMLRLKGFYISSLLLLILVGETAVWHRGIVRPIRYDPFTPAPFISFLRQQKEEYRTFGFDRIIQPSIPTGYDIDDGRFIAALVPKERFLFINQFIAPGEYTPEYLMKPGEFFSEDIPRRITTAFLDPANSHGVELVEKIKLQGTEIPLYLGKFFDLLNMRYILATNDRQTVDQISIATLPSITSLLKDQYGTTVQTLTSGDTVRQGMIIQSSAPVTLPLLLPSGQVSLHFSIGVAPDILQTQVQTSSLNYRVLLTDAQGEHDVFHRHVDSKAASIDGWIDESVDLSAWSGQRIALTLAVDGDPSSPNKAIPGYWSLPILQLQSSLTTWARQNLQAIDTIDLKTALLANNISKEGPILGNSAVTIDNEQRSTLFLLPNNTAPLQVQIPNAATRLTFAIAMDPQVWTKENAGDGVTFRVAVKDAITTTEVFNRYIDPKHNPDERHWISAEVDLSKWRGQSVALELTTDSGPKGDRIWDLAHWSHIALAGQGVGVANPDIAHFQLVYDKEIQVYRNNFAYPRAFVVYNVEKAQNIDDSIRKLARSDFDPSTQAVVQTQPQNSNEQILNNTNPSPASNPAQIMKHTANTVQITASLEKPGLLVLSNTYNTGWKAYVDGKSVSVQKVDLFLQGVYLSPGSHVIDMVYAPLSFTIGSIISSSALLGLVVTCVVMNIKKRRA